MRKLLLSATAAMSLAASAIAHHAANATYDLRQEVDMTGKVTRVALRNPHVRFYFSVPGEDGTEIEWMAEGGSWSVLSRNGWAGAEVRVGDVIGFHGHPSRIGENSIHIVAITLRDGREVWSEDGSPSGIESLRERRRVRIGDLDQHNSKTQ